MAIDRYIRIFRYSIVGFHLSYKTLLIQNQQLKFSQFNGDTKKAHSRINCMSNSALVYMTITFIMLLDCNSQRRVSYSVQEKLGMQRTDTLSLAYKVQM